MQHYLVFQPFKYFKTLGAKINQIIVWFTNRLSVESNRNCKLTTLSNNSFDLRMAFLMVEKLK